MISEAIEKLDRLLDSLGRLGKIIRALGFPLGVVFIMGTMVFSGIFLMLATLAIKILPDRLGRRVDERIFLVVSGVLCVAIIWFEFPVIFVIIAAAYASFAVVGLCLGIFLAIGWLWRRDGLGRISLMLCIWSGIFYLALKEQSPMWAIISVIFLSSSVLAMYLSCRILLGFSTLNPTTIAPIILNLVAYMFANQSAFHNNLSDLNIFDIEYILYIWRDEWGSVIFALTMSASWAVLIVWSFAGIAMLIAYSWNIELGTLRNPRDQKLRDVFIQVFFVINMVSVSALAGGSTSGIVLGLAGIVFAIYTAATVKYLLNNTPAPEES